MERFKITTEVFPELTEEDIPVFKQFMAKEFDGYLEDNEYVLAHNEADSGWFTKQFLDGRKGKGLYQSFFSELLNNSSVS